MRTMCNKSLWLSTAVVVMAVGCVPAAETDVTGTVQGEDFTAVTGTAEGSATGGYSITLSDDHAFDCTSTPVGEYLTVAVGGVDSPGTIDAAGNVSFNVVDGEMQNSEAATAGTVTIDLIEVDDDGESETEDEDEDDDSTRPLIEGSIDASGDDSQAEGTFSVPICD